MTPNAGYGGNAAIESAAALANAIKKLADATKDSRPTESQITACLKSYQQTREVRVTATIQAANMLTRIQALATVFHSIFVYYCVGVLGDILVNLGADVSVGAVMIDYLPPPLASLQGTMPFNPEQGDGMKESIPRRALFALPILVLSVAGVYLIDPTPGLSALGEILQAGSIAVRDVEVPIQWNFYGVEWLDKLWVTINIFFTPAAFGIDPIGRTQLASFLVDFGVILSIWSIEAVRRGNALTPAQLPGLFTGLAQLRGIGMLAPVYYFFSSTLTPIANFKATDMRLTDLRKTRAILPSLILTYYLPMLGAGLWPDLYARQSFIFIWQMYPLWHSSTQWVLSKLFEDTVQVDRLRAPKRDVGVIRYTVGVCVAFSVATWGYTLVTAPAPFSQIFIPRGLGTADITIAKAVHQLLQWDHILLFTSTYLWLGYFFWDAKVAGMTDASWGKALALAGLATLLLGPGATAGLGWLWREYVITEKRHKAAVTLETAEKQGWKIGGEVKDSKEKMAA